MRDIDVNLVTAFITQPQSTIRTVDDLKGTRFAFGARGSVEAGVVAHPFLDPKGGAPRPDLALAPCFGGSPPANAGSPPGVGERARPGARVARAGGPCPR